MYFRLSNYGKNFFLCFEFVLDLYEDWCCIIISVFMKFKEKVLTVLRAIWKLYRICERNFR